MEKPHKITVYRISYKIRNDSIMPIVGFGNNPMVGMTVACAVAVNEALNK